MVKDIISERWIGGNIEYTRVEGTNIEMGA